VGLLYGACSAIVLAETGFVVHAVSAGRSLLFATVRALRYGCPADAGGSGNCLCAAFLSTLVTQRWPDRGPRVLQRADEPASGLS